MQNLKNGQITERNAVSSKIEQAYIIYYEKEGEKNSGFIEMLKTEGRKYEIDLKYISYEEIEVMSDSIFMKTFKNVVFVINRTRKYELSKKIESLKIKVFHSSKITELGNDKYKTYCYLKYYFKKKKSDKYLIADTILVKEKDLKKTLENYIGEDYIIKSVDGHGGNQVFWLKSELESNVHTIYENLKGHNCVLQKRIESDSNDIRVYVLFGKIYASVLRHGNDDFKSNYSLGGSVTEYFPDKQQREYIQKFIDAFGENELCMVGIDFILTTDGKLIFNELEEMVGSRMLYNCSKHDIVRNYMEQIAKNEIKAL